MSIIQKNYQSAKVNCYIPFMSWAVASAIITVSMVSMGISFYLLFIMVAAGMAF